MSLRSLLSRLLTPRSHSHRSDNGLDGLELNNHGSDRHGLKKSAANDRQPTPTWRYYLVQFLIITTLLLSAVWLLMAIWYQFGAGSAITWLTAILIVGVLTALLSIHYWPKMAKRFDNKQWGKKTTISSKSANKWLTTLYCAIWLVGVGWFFSIEPQQERDWMAEVSERVTYERDATNPDLVTLTNVRNFDWHTDTEATERWDTRTIDLSKLSGVDVTNSYWMGPLIAHTLVSFRFEDDRPLAFSFEIRKENGESFSALAGFFRRYELSLIAAEERDIIYTRTNARGEQVYLFPVSNLQQHEIKSLFESYLTAADELNAKPAWYNTLLSNCTNIIFYMARIVSGDRLPWDYRIWVSGWLPNYLYDVGMLDANPKKDGNPWSMDEWYERTHINPKVRGFDNQTSDLTNNARNFSMQIRQGIPIPPLADSQAAAESKAQSAALVSHP
ncbi:lipoprotein N-acyltransferase Lnb domain-containing protein [Psychrobacter aquimaris]|uniref:lipoprotein N-acyltransferase Lnb domain-containing protein n=1 Tax=Psychrobacter aquimaris TaxID=292733 RepID=UPI003FD5F9F2